MPRALAYLLIALLTTATVFLGWMVSRTGGDPGAASRDSEITRSPGDKGSPSPADTPVPHLIRQLVDPSKHIEEQIESVRALPDDLTPEEFAALIDILHQASPPQTAPSRWYALQNEIMEVLRQPRFTWEGYPGAMAGLVSDRNADPVMRDYAAQHLVLYLGERADQLPEETMTRSLAALFGVLGGSRESHQMVCGTTLMALCDLDIRRPQLLETHRPTLGASVLALITGDQPASISNQIAAIQAAGRMGFTEALPAIRRFAAGEAPTPSTRLSSVAALGYFAAPEDRAFLTELATGDSNLRFAAKSALKNFQTP